MKTSRQLFIAFAIVSTLVLSCTKEIEVELPVVNPKIVVEGSIEQGQPPLVLLSWTQGYFEPTDINSLQDIFVRDAMVTVTNGLDTVVLDQICSSEIPEDLIPLVTEATGISAELLQAVDLCIYTSFNETIWGETGKIYELTVQYEEHLLHSKTKINSLIELDSAWFQLSGDSDSLGFAYAILTDPDTTGNAYRWFAKRINNYPEWSLHAGEQKDNSFIAPLGSVYDDTFFNGLSFEFAYYRGLIPNSSKEDDLNDERGFFKTGDTIAVRGCVIDRSAYDFFVTFENQAANQGSPLAVPANPISNVSGGLGIWVGYGAIYDTIICVP